MFNELMMLEISSGCGGFNTIDWDTDFCKYDLKLILLFILSAFSAIDFPILTK